MLKKIYNYLIIPFIEFILGLFYNMYPIKKIIILESSPDYSDNTYYLYKCMIDNKINDNYVIYWLTTDDKTYDNNKNVYFLNRKSQKFSEFKQIIKLKHTAKCLICCNYFLRSYRRKQISIYLSHGMPVKDVSSYYYPPSTINYILATSKSMADVMTKQCHCNKDRIFICGQPRNDVLITNKNSNILKDIFHNKYSKIIGWYPTFRQHKTGISYDKLNAIPLIWNIDNALKLDSLLIKNNILILIKPHPAQDISFIKKFNLKNILFIDDDFIKLNNMTSYEFLSQLDSLITDYSSIYFDFLLCNKPIAVVWEDIEEYRSNPGFAVDVDYYMSCTDIIYNIDNMLSYVNNISLGIDQHLSARLKICSEVNLYDQPINSEKTLEFVLSKLER